MIDLTGKTFGYLTVLRINSFNKKGESWLCRCCCGQEIVASTSNLIGENPRKSCGCKNNKGQGKSVKYRRLYNIWKQMLYRCYHEKYPAYSKYGGRGITVCDEWRNSFDSFLEWAFNNGYDPKLTLDRIDNDKGYYPDNCRWTNYFVQEQNKGLRINNTTGYKGVCPHKNGKYKAYMRRNGIRKHLGLFNSIEEAAIARQKAEERFLMTGTF